MKIRTNDLKLLVLSAFCMVSGVAVGQEQLVRLPSRDLTAEQAIAQIESQTDIVIGVNHNTFDTSRTFRAAAEDISVDGLLDQMTAGSGFTYLKRGKHVIIVPAPQPQAVKTKGTASSGDTPKNIQPGAIAAQSAEAEQQTKQNHDADGQQACDTAAAGVPSTGAALEIRVYDEIVGKEVDKTFSFTVRDPEEFRKDGAKYPKFAIKTNLLYGAAALAPNVGIEFGVGKKTTMEIAYGVNRWNRRGTFEDNKKLIHTLVQPEFRWWTCERFNGHFFGVHVLGANYNISQHNIPLIGFKKDYRYEGYALGAGVSYGYMAMLSRSTGLEFTLGVGAVWLDYNRYDCTKCALDYTHFSPVRFAVTKAGVSLVFIIK